MSRPETDWSEGLRAQLMTARACRAVVNGLAGATVLTLGALVAIWMWGTEPSPNEDFNPDQAGTQLPAENQHEHVQ